MSKTGIPAQDTHDENLDETAREVELESISSYGKGDLLSQEDVDPVLNMKMHLVNDVSEYLMCL